MFQRSIRVISMAGLYNTYRQMKHVISDIILA